MDRKRARGGRASATKETSSAATRSTAIASRAVGEDSCGCALPCPHRGSTWFDTLGCSRATAESGPKAPAAPGRFKPEPAKGDQLSLRGLLGGGQETKEPRSARSRWSWSPSTALFRQEKYSINGNEPAIREQAACSPRFDDERAPMRARSADANCPAQGIDCLAQGIDCLAGAFAVNECPRISAQCRGMLRDPAVARMLL